VRAGSAALRRLSQTVTASHDYGQGNGPRTAGRVIGYPPRPASRGSPSAQSGTSRDNRGAAGPGGFTADSSTCPEPGRPGSLPWGAGSFC